MHDKDAQPHNIRNVAVSIPGTEVLHAHLANPDAAAPAPTPLRTFRAAPEALCTRFDIGSLANDNAVFHFCFQVPEAAAVIPAYQTKEEAVMFTRSPHTGDSS